MEEPRLKDVEELADELEEESGTDSSQAKPHLEQAYAHEARDEFEEGLHECDLAIELDPHSAEAHNRRGAFLEESIRAFEGPSLATIPVKSLQTW
jgi:Flp pilus assembly protein TadD